MPAIPYKNRIAGIYFLKAAIFRKYNIKVITLS